MEWGLELIQLKALVISGLAAWLTIAATNNIIDRGTNIHLLTMMVSMRELESDPVLGKGLLFRAIKKTWLPQVLLVVVVLAQFSIVILLFRGAYFLSFGSDPAFAISVANLGLAAFSLLWLFFLTGGMWFGYWMKMPQVQQVHLTLFLISNVTMVLVNS